MHHTYIKHILLLFLLFALFVISSSSQTNEAVKPYDPALPFADYNPSLPKKPQQRLIRERRNRQYNLSIEENGGNVDPRKFAIVELSQTTYGLSPTHAIPKPAIPAVSCNTIVVGSIKSSKAYLSEDRTSLYSEFDLRIGQIIKNDASLSLAVGTKITISRYGGAVKLPSGKIIKRASMVTLLPRVGNKYIFFLTYNAESENYFIITAYQINNKKIIPLDGLVDDRIVDRVFEAHQSYRGTSEQEFLKIV